LDRAAQPASKVVSRTLNLAEVRNLAWLAIASIKLLFHHSQFLQK
jgi:hypothetical protein